MKKNGFTLIELLIVFGILAFCLCGILLTYLNMLLLSDLSRDLTLVTNAVQAKMEEIKKTNFDCLFSSGTSCGNCTSCFYNGQVFNITGVGSADAKGRIEICDTTTCPTIISYADLKRARLTACFKSRERLFGEDSNLDGNLTEAEDINDNDRLDSPVELITLIAR